MFRRRYLWVPVVGLILIGLLVAGGFAVHQMAWSRGYAMGQAAGVEEGEALVRPSPFGWGHPGRYYGYSPLGSGFGIVVKLFLVILAIGFLFKLFGFAMWMLMGPRVRRYHIGRRRPRGWHPHHRFPPHWYWDWEEADEDETHDAEPADKADAGEQEG